MSAHLPDLRRPAVQLAILALLSTLAAVPAGAQTTAAPTAADARSYDIPPGPLSPALSRFAGQAGVTLSTDPALTEGLNTPGLRGRAGVLDGFAQLLQGTGLTVGQVGGQAFVLRRAPVASSAKTSNNTLPLVTVTAHLLGSITESTGSYTTRSMSAANKLDLSIRETPQSVSVVTRELLDDSGAATLTDALRLVPGTVVESSGPGYSSTLVRGFTLNNLQVDGLSYNLASSYDDYLFDTLNTASLDHVEVVRGATGIVTGNGQPSGTVNVVRKRPTHEFQAQAKGALGNYSAYAAEFDAGGPLNTAGSLRGRAVARLEDQQDHYQGHYRKRRPMLYGVLDADLGPDTALSLALDWQRIDGDGLANFRALTGMYADGSRFEVPRRLNLSPAWERADQERASATLTLEHALSDAWKLKLAYARQNASLNYKFLEVGLPQTDGAVTGNYGTRNDYDSRRGLFEASVDGRFALFGREHRVVAGYVDSRQKTLADTHWEGSNLAPINYRTFDPGTYPEPEWWKVQTSRYDVKTSALYASSLWSLADPLKLQAGARWSRYRQDEHVLYQDYDYTGSGGAPYQSADYDHRGVFTPFLGLVYDVAPAASLYGSYARTFQIQSDSVRDREGLLLDPRQGSSVELGVKVEPRPQLTLSAAVFQLKQSNVAQQAGEFTDGDLIRRFGRYYFEGGAGQITRGVELEASGSITRQWQLMGGYTRQNVRRNDGTQVQTLPRDIVKLATQYQLAGSLQGLSVGGAVHWQSVRETVRWTNGASFRLDPYTLVSAWAAYRITPQWTARLAITNLTDEVYQSNTNVFVNYGEARRVWLSMDYRF